MRVKTKGHSGKHEVNDKKREGTRDERFIVYPRRFAKTHLLQTLLPF